MAGVAEGFGAGVTRILTVTCGLCSIAWAIWTVPVFQREAVFASPSQHILSGEQYGTRQLDEFRQQADSFGDAVMRPAALVNVVAIRLRLMEKVLAHPDGQASASSVDSLEAALGAALAVDPSAPFLWLAKYWVQAVRLGYTASDFKLLRMSYLLGPNEGWIAVNRNPFVLGLFSSLPADLATDVLSEFKRMVQSELYVNAAGILAGANAPVRKLLLDEVAQVGEGSRRQLANALRAKGQDDIEIPGVVEPVSRSDSFLERNREQPLIPK